MADHIKSLPGEIWKPVVGHEGRYEVSNCGRVRRCAYSVDIKSRWGTTATWHYPEMLMRLVVRHIRNNYSRVVVGLAGKQRYVHRLVLEAFVGPCPCEQEVCHWDGDAKNNHLSNLRYGSRHDNHEDSRRHGTLAIGSKSGTASINERTAEAIFAARQRGATYAIIMRRFKVSKTVVCFICTGRAWRHVTGLSVPRVG
jgi:hypothetical protein